MYECPGIWLNGQLYPFMAGGSGEGDDGSYPADAGVAVTSGSAQLDDAGPDDSPDDSRYEPETSDDDGDSTQAPSAIDRFSQSLAPHQQYQEPPRAADPIHSEIQQLQVAEQMALQRIQAQMPFLPEDQQQRLAYEFQAARVQAQARIVQLQGEAQRAAIEPHVRELTLDRLVEIAREDNPKLDGKELRSELKALADSGAPARSVLEATQRFVQKYRATALKERDTKGTDRVGGGQTRSANALNGKSTMDLLSMGYRDSSPARGRRGR